ncbi:MAG TPA: FHA domain-containing protein [Solirubrobacteraceae bacterium]|nr:FHA domain-containing protein [Solirubrobacteraceae bacterium]
MADTRPLPVPGGEVGSSSAAALALVLPDGSRVPIAGELTIGRGDDASVRIDDRTVSRAHARIHPGPAGPLLEDSGSRFGTLLDGAPVTEPRPLRVGSEIRVGEVTLVVDSDAPPQPLPAEAGETVVMPVGATQLGLRPAAAAATSSAGAGGFDGALRPRVRSGWALKRLGADEGERRFVLRDLRDGSFMRMDAEDAALFEMLDGSRTVLELLGTAERALGPAGPGRLVRLLAELSDRELLDGGGGGATAAPDGAGAGWEALGGMPGAAHGGAAHGGMPGLAPGGAAPSGAGKASAGAGHGLGGVASGMERAALAGGGVGGMERVARGAAMQKLGRGEAKLGRMGRRAAKLERAKTPPSGSRLAQLVQPRERTYEWVGERCERAYHHWGRVFFAPLTVTFLALFALAGFAAFSYIVGARYGTPFVVANRLVIGGAVYMLGRFLLVAVHELAHGMALVHYGRRPARGGLRLILFFPYAFVDTSEAYFEPRAHRIAISAAGPVSDLSFGALFSFLCAVWPAGSVRDVFFQLAFGSYVGAFFNLNPFLDRDGYHIVVDVLREPGLRQRARAQFTRRLSGAPAAEGDSPVLLRYGIFALVWSVLAAAFVMVFSTRYYDRLVALAPPGVVIVVFVVFWVVLFIPVGLTLGLPLWRRLRYGTTEVNRVIR